ncbi:helix-turn-helix transcriptional regulator [Miltoncostaea marina]|uniref:helix-turn-helix transcriptional regulator n=1 Tax=Miltoncostaea marina TaxID=2843215 RepID=UPI001C3D894C|nr:response regulator transcription factor [Miltoncostaea marina]
MQGAPVRVVIAHRSPAWTAGVAAFLAYEPLCTDGAHTVDGALARLATPADLVIVGRLLADAPGAELADEVRRRLPGARMLFALDDDSPEQQLEALAAGACGWLLTTWTREAVVEAVTDALRGVGRFDAEALRPLADLARRTNPREVTLTEQERVVLRLMRQRLTYKEIALRLGVSWHTVRTHAQSILRKFGVHSRRDLDAWDARMGEPGPVAATTGSAATGPIGPRAEVQLDVSAATRPTPGLPRG